MPTWKVTLEYEGTRYHGWQEQRAARTVAGEVRAAAERVLGASVGLSGAGRTDAGVHALGQVARLTAGRRMRAGELAMGINDNLPADINVLGLKEVSDSFDPRRDALGRYYLYQISMRRTAFAKRFVWWVKDRLDADRMRDAAAALVGRHDFARFCEKREGEKSTIVVVDDVELVCDGELLLFRISASHFLWKMVRRLVGGLVEVGRGHITADAFKGLVEGVSERKVAFDVAAHTAPPSGLFLERIIYEKNQEKGQIAPAFFVRRL